MNRKTTRHCGMVPAVLATIIAVVGFGISWQTAIAENSERKPNILLITLDTTRADHVTLYGYPKKTSPFLSRLSKSSTYLFTSAWTTSPLTLPAHASLFTGLAVEDHGVLDNGLYSLDAAHVSIVPRLKDSGYDTRAYISSVVLDRRYGLERGFSHYDDRVRMGKRSYFNYRERAASQVVETMAEDLRNWRQPWFSWLHLYDPHDPYVPPRPWNIMFDHPYDGEISFVDNQIERIVDFLHSQRLFSLTRDWLIVVGDHGEDLGDYGEQRHGILLTPATMHIPLFIRIPGLKGRIVETPVSLTDVVKILETVVTAQGRSGAAGDRNVEQVLHGLTGTRDRPLTMVTWMPWHSFHWSPLIGILQGTILSIAGQRSIANSIDDGTMKPIGTGENATIGKNVSAQLTGLKKKLIGQASQASADMRTLQQLQSLGYETSVVVPTGEDPFSLPDPRDKVPFHAAFIACKEKQSTVPGSEFRRCLETILASDSRNLLVMNNLAPVLEQEGRYNEAEKLLLFVVEQASGQDYSCLQLGEFYGRRGRNNDAERILLRGLSHNPRNADLYDALFQTQVRLKNFSAAFETLKKAREQHVADPLLFLYMAKQARTEKRWSDALSAIDASLDLDPLQLLSLIEKARIVCAADSPLTTACDGFAETKGHLLARDAEWWTLLAVHYERSNRLPQAMTCLMRAKDLNTGNPAAPQFRDIERSIQRLVRAGIQPGPLTFGGN